MRFAVMKGLGTALVVSMSLLSAAGAMPVATARFHDVLDTPAVAVGQPAHAPLLDVAMAGKRIVAVGLRGVIVYSDDDGATWQQSSCPVSTDLVSIQFIDANSGWATGHDGVVLHSSDGGKHWQKQLDGRLAAKLTLDYYNARVAQGDAAADGALKLAKTNYESGPDLPFLGVWFENLREGYAVGSFGLIVHTDDGGKTWQPWLEHIDNPQGLNLNAVRGVNGQVYIAGEQGVMFRLDRAAKRFIAVKTGYTGSLFALLGVGHDVIAFGLRGKAYRSDDDGKQWHEMVSGSEAAITAGVVLKDGRLALVNQAGQVLVGADTGKGFQAIPVPRPDLFTGAVVASTGTLVAVGLGGAQRELIGRVSK